MPLKVRLPALVNWAFVWVVPVCTVNMAPETTENIEPEVLAATVAFVVAATLSLAPVYVPALKANEPPEITLKVVPIIKNEYMNL